MKVVFQFFILPLSGEHTAGVSAVKAKGTNFCFGVVDSEAVLTVIVRRNRGNGCNGASNFTESISLRCKAEITSVDEALSPRV